MTWTEKRRARVSGGELAFVDAGDPEAPAVVLLSGGVTSSYLWRDLIPLLVAVDAGDRARPARVGRLRVVGRRGSPARRARRLDPSVARRARRRAVRGRGHGHGGGIAQLLALDGDVDALVLVDSIAFDAWPAPRMRELRERVDEVDPDAVVAWLEAALEGGTRQGRLREEDVDEYLRPFRGPDGLERFVRVARSFDGEGSKGLESRFGGARDPGARPVGRGRRVRRRSSSPSASATPCRGRPSRSSRVAGTSCWRTRPRPVAPLVFQWLRSMYLKVEHRHEERTRRRSTLGRRPPGEGGCTRDDSGCSSPASRRQGTTARTRGRRTSRRTSSSTSTSRSR